MASQATGKFRAMWASALCVPNTGFITTLAMAVSSQSCRKLV